MRRRGKPVSPLPASQPSALAHPRSHSVVDAKEAASPAFHFGQVDCIANADLCQTQNVEGYPTIRLLKQGKIDKEYNAERDIETLLLFVDQNLPLPSSHFPLLATDNSTLPTSDSTAKPVITKNKSSLKPNKVAVKLETAPEETKFHIATAPPTPTHNDEPPTVAQSTSVVANSTPTETREPVGDGKVIALYGQEALRAVRTSKDPSFVKFFVKWCHHCQALAPSTSNPPFHQFSETDLRS